MQESIFGNALKALMNQIAMVLLAFEGAQLYMKYLAAIALQNQLLQRKELVHNLVQQYTGLISIVQKMMNLDAQELNAFQEIQLSRTYVQSAVIMNNLFDEYSLGIEV